MTSITETFVAQPPIGGLGAFLAKCAILALFYWLGYSLVCALAGAILHPFGEYAEHVRWGFIVACWVIATVWIYKSDLNNP